MTAGAVPVPASPTVCGLPVASSAKLTLALNAPVAVGANFTPTLQALPAVNELAPREQAVPVEGAPRVNCAGFVPVNVMLVILSVALPVLVRVMLLVALVVLTT